MWRTEEEAKNSACPLARLDANRIGNCVGSLCMMWRQNIITDNGTTETKGYCGLAGVPPR